MGNAAFCALAAFTFRFFCVCILSSVHQVSTKRTSSCPPALRCPAGGALVTARPARFRSSAAPGASSVRASRRSSDRPDGSVLHPLLPLRLPDPTPHATFYSFKFLPLRSSDSAAALRRSSSERFVGVFLRRRKGSSAADGSSSGRRLRSKR